MKIRGYIAHIALLVLLGVAVYFNSFSDGFLRIISGVWLVMFAPGLPIYLIFQKKKIEFFDAVLFAIGLSMTYVMVIGAALSLGKESLGLVQPLTYLPIHMSLVWVAVAGSLFGAWWNWKTIFEADIPKQELFFSLPFLGLILCTIVGTFRLNAGLDTQLPFYLLIALPLGGMVL